MGLIDLNLSIKESGKSAPSYSLQGDLGGELTLEELFAFTKSALIETAQTALTEEQALGFDRDPVVVVDGKTDKSINFVNPLGKIQFISRRNLNDVILAAYDGVVERSPVRTGLYQASNEVFINRVKVASNSTDLSNYLNSNPPDTNDVIQIVNTVPYARRLERLGVTGQRTQSRYVSSRDRKRRERGLKFIAPNGAYFLTVRSIQRSFKRNAYIRFSFEPGTSFGIGGSFKRGRGGGRAYLYPTITIVGTEGGVL